MTSIRSVVASATLVALISMPGFAQTTIAPDSDVTYRGTTRYNNTSVFGVFTKGNGTTDRGYLEFRLGNTACTSATLRLYNYWSNAGAPVNFDVRIRAISEDEAGYVVWTDTAGPAPSGTAHETTWTLVGDFHVDNTPAWYTLDITSLYNTNLGEKVTFSIRALSGAGDGPIFEDKESTGGGAQMPVIEIVSSDPTAPIIAEVAPDPATVVAGLEYQRQLGLLAGTPPITWSIVPTTSATPGLSVDQNGRVSGWTPTSDDAGQTFTIEVKATNVYGSDSETWNVDVFSPITSCARTFPGATWEFRTPGEAGMDGAMLDQIAATIGGNGCIVRKGFMVKTWGSQSAKADWASAAKPVISTMLFFAINEDLIASVDNLVVDQNWALIAKDQSMSFRHMADMTGNYTRAEAPGAAWAYNDYNIQLYAKTLFDRVYGETPNTAAAHADRLGALQFQDGSIFSSRGGYGLSTSVRDFARIGWFWANRGNWNGMQVLPQHYFNDYMRPDVSPDLPRTTASDPAGDYLGIGSYGGGSDATPYGPGIYGFNWWFNATGGIHPSSMTWPDAPADTFQANGHFGREVLTVIPSLKVVMAYFGGATLSFEPGNAASSTNLVLKLLKDSVATQAPSIELNESAIARVVDFSDNLLDDPFVVANCGDGTLNYTISDDQSWLSVYPQTGSASAESDTVVISYSVENLPVGMHQATVTVSDNGSIPAATNSPQTITINVSVRSVLPDLDLDGDVDQVDYGRFQRCFTDPDDPGVIPGCESADFNQDLQIDQEDLDVLLGCASGPMVLADRSCDDALE